MNSCSPLVVTFMSQVTEYLLPLLGIAITGLVGFAAKKWQDYTNVQVSAEQRATIEQALRGALGHAAEKALQANLDTTQPSVRAAMAADAKQYVKDAIPDALAGKGLGEADVARLVTSRMAGKPNIAAPVEPLPAVAVAVSPAPAA